MNLSNPLSLCLTRAATACSLRAAKHGPIKNNGAGFAALVPIWEKKKMRKKAEFQKPARNGRKSSQRGSTACCGKKAQSRRFAGCCGTTRKWVFTIVQAAGKNSLNPAQNLNQALAGRAFFPPLMQRK